MMGDPVQSTISDPGVDDLAFHHMKDMLHLGTHLRFGPIPLPLLNGKGTMTTAFLLCEIPGIRCMLTKHRLLG